MRLNFIVSGQNLIRVPSEQKIKLASHNKKAIFSVELRSEEWREQIVAVLFTYKGKTWKKILGAEADLAFNECYIPAEVVFPGTFSITLSCNNGSVTLPCLIEVVSSGYTEVIENEDVTPSTLDQINSLMKKYALVCNSILQDCKKIKEEISREE